ncbi:MAG: hypothetical protein ACTSPI_03380 [Candidatus Heimdallarchaeaceae archaeon]
MAQMMIDISKKEGKPVFESWNHDLEIKEAKESERSFLAVASTEDKDRDGDIIKIKGWILDRYLKNNVGLWAHDYSSIPIFRSIETFIKGKKLLFRPQFATHENAMLIYRMFLDDYLRTFSVGFIPESWNLIPEEEEEDKKRPGDYHRETPYGKEFVSQTLLEISACPVPSNPAAHVLMMSKGLYIPFKYERRSYLIKGILDEYFPEKTPDIYRKSLYGYEKTPNEFVSFRQSFYEKEEEKGICGSKNLPLADEGREWDGSGARKRMLARAGGKDNFNKAKYKQGFVALVGKGDNLGDYKLPFADVINGKLMAVWRGVSAAGGVLQGARGGVDGVNLQAARSFLTPYYKKFGKDAPWNKSFLNDLISFRESFYKFDDEIEETETLNDSCNLSKEEKDKIFEEIGNLINVIEELKNEIAELKKGEIDEGDEDDFLDWETVINNMIDNTDEINYNDLSDWKSIL